MKLFTTRRAFSPLVLGAAVGVSLGVAGCGGGSNGPQGATNNAGDVPVGKIARDLPIGDDLAEDVSWSPDGQYLAYAGSKFRGLKAPSFGGVVYQKIRIIRADGASEPRDLGIAGSTGDQSSPSWGR